MTSARIIRWLFLGTFLLFTLAVNANADSIRVRGGEHGGFTRLALDLPENTGWKITQSDDGYHVAFANSGHVLDTSNTFQKLNADRIRSVNAINDGSVLSIALNCDCPVRSFLLGDRMLVLDFSNAASADHSPTMNRVSARANESDRIPERAWLEFSRAGGEPNTVVAGKTTHRAGPSQPHHSLHEYASLLLDLSFEFGRSGKGAVRAVEREDPIPGEDRLPINFRARNGSEEPGPDTAPSSETRAGNTIDCLMIEDLDIASWGRPEAFSSDVSKLRRQLYREFDTLDHEVAGKLVKLYIYHGFFDEASLLSRQIADEKEPLLAIFKALERASVTGERSMPDHSICPESSPLWAFLSRNPEDDRFEPDTTGIMSEFSRLPGLVRNIVTRELVERLIRHGHVDASEEVLGMAARGGGEEDGMVLLAEGMLKKEKGLSEEAHSAFAQASQANNESSPKATIEMVAALSAENAPMDYSEAQRIGVLAHEYKGSPEESELRHASVKSLAMASSYEEALVELGRLRESIDAEGFEKARNFVFQKISQNAPDALFLTTALGLDGDARNELSVEVANMMGDRLVSLGFPEEAIAFLEGNEKGRGSPERAVILSRAVSGHPDRKDKEGDGKRGVADSVGGRDGEKIRLDDVRDLLAKSDATMREIEDMLETPWAN